VIANGRGRYIRCWGKGLARGASQLAMRDPPSEIHYNAQRMLIVVLVLVCSMILLFVSRRAYDLWYRAKDAAASKRLTGR
jgi:hypothetical protein